MAYAYDQKWPVEPRGPTLSLSWGRGPDVTTPDAIQTWSDIATMAFYLLVQVTSSSIIIVYDPSHSLARHTPQVSPMWNPDYHASTDSPLILERHVQLPDFIRDPSPAAFMLACLAYAFAAAAFYRLHPNDKYQHRFLLLAVCSATFLSFPSIHGMRSWLPSMTTAALVLSLFTHSAFPSLRAEAVKKVEGSDVKNNMPSGQEKQLEQPDMTSRC